MKSDDGDCCFSQCGPGLARLWPFKGDHEKVTSVGTEQENDDNINIPDNDVKTISVKEKCDTSLNQEDLKSKMVHKVS